MSKKKSQKFFFFLTLASLFIILVIFTSLDNPRKPLEREVFACQTQDFLGKFSPEEKIAVFEGSQIPVVLAQIPQETTDSSVLSVASYFEKWIEVDLSEQRLKAWEGDKLFLETPVSTGLSWWPTPEGEYRIWIKLRYTKMEGGEGNYYYYLPNVPYVMFFEGSGIPGWRGYGLHGTYWHNDFGTPKSHGCVNLPIPIAEKLFYWTTPTLPDGKWVVLSSENNPGTRIVIHE